MAKEIEKIEKVFKDEKSQKNTIKSALYIEILENLLQEAIDSAKMYQAESTRANDRLEKALNRLSENQTF